MTRTSVAYIAVVAAGVSAGALGFSVFWAYQLPDESAPPMVSVVPAPEAVPPVAQSAAPAEIVAAPVAPVASAPPSESPPRPTVTATPSGVLAKSAAPTGPATDLSMPGSDNVRPVAAPSASGISAPGIASASPPMQPVPAQTPALAPVAASPAPARGSDASSSPPSRAIEPKIASAPATEPSKMKPNAPVPAGELSRTEAKRETAPRMQERHANAPTRSLGAPAAPSAAPIAVRPAIDSSLAITGAQAAPAATPPVQIGHANAGTTKLHIPAPQVEVPVAARPLIDSTPVIASQSEAANKPIAAPTQHGHANSPPTRLGPLPQTETSAVARPPIDVAPAGVTPIERHTWAAPPAASGHTSAPPAKFYAPPQGAEAARRSTEPERAVPRRLAAVPPQSETPRKPIATDAPPVLVLRGGPPPARYAQAGRPPPQQTVIKVVRGARPLPTGLEGIVQPGALLLRVPD